MSVLGYLRGQRLPMILQSEMAECGLTSLAMVVAYHGHKVDLNGLRQRLPCWLWPVVHTLSTGPNQPLIIDEGNSLGRMTMNEIFGADDQKLEEVQTHSPLPIRELNLAEILTRELTTGEVRAVAGGPAIVNQG